eukprot:scaffold1548_cov186-Pinguiococcus_pyrenoidosus.AAC.3
MSTLTEENEPTEVDSHPEALTVGARDVRQRVGPLGNLLDLAVRHDRVDIYKYLKEDLAMQPSLRYVHRLPLALAVEHVGCMKTPGDVAEHIFHQDPNQVFMADGPTRRRSVVWLAAAYGNIRLLKLFHHARKPEDAELPPQFTWLPATTGQELVQLCDHNTSYGSRQADPLCYMSRKAMMSFRSAILNSRKSLQYGKRVPPAHHANDRDGGDIPTDYHRGMDDGHLAPHAIAMNLASVKEENLRALSVSLRPVLSVLLSLLGSGRHDIIFAERSDTHQGISFHFMG